MYFDRLSSSNSLEIAKIAFRAPIAFFVGRTVVQFLSSGVYMVGCKVAGCMNRHELAQSFRELSQASLEVAKKNWKKDIAIGVLFAAVDLQFIRDQSLFDHDPSSVRNTKFLNALFLDPAQDCISQLQTCQQMINEHFPHCEDSYCTPLSIALDCVGNPEKICQEVVKTSFPKFVEENIFSGLLLAKACIGETDSASKEVVGKAFELFTEKNPLAGSSFAEACIGKTDNACKEIVGKAFQILTEKDPFTGWSFAQQCIGKEPEVVKEAFSWFVTAKRPITVEPGSSTIDDLGLLSDFVKACNETPDEFCQNKVMPEAFSIFLERKDLSSATSLLKGCDNQDTKPCLEIVERAKKGSLI